MTDPTIEEVREALTALLAESDETRQSDGPSASLLIADGRSAAYRAALKLLEPKPRPIEDVITWLIAARQDNDCSAEVTVQIILSALRDEGYRIVHESEQP